MKLIIGLGNPGLEYQNTRHNIGFKVLDNYLDNPLWQTKFNGEFYKTVINNEATIFLKPLTYMNLSGTCILKFVNYFKININDILVIQDDLDLPLGTYRLKTNSTSGGHNGIKSIIENLNTTDFARLKIGISKNTNIDTKDYVLGKFSKEEEETLTNIYPITKSIINDFINNKDINKLMNDYNR